MLILRFINSVHDCRVYRLAVESISLLSVEHHRCSVTCLTNYTCLELSNLTYAHMYICCYIKNKIINLIINLFCISIIKITFNFIYMQYSFTILTILEFTYVFLLCMCTTPYNFYNLSIKD